jgi:ABC-type nitrate/sulfonate/bicarbonate transport system permease component
MAADVRAGANRQRLPLALGFPLLLFASCEALVRHGPLNVSYAPAPSDVLAAVVRGAVAGDLLLHTGATLMRLASAFVLAAVPGVVLGLLIGVWGPVRRVVDPYMALLYPLPKIALLPLLLIIMGVGESAFVFAGSLTAFFQILISTADGVAQVDRGLLEVGHNYGARGLRLFRAIVLPAALPSILTGLRLGLGLTLITVIAVEFTAAKSGLGQLAFRHWQTLSVAEMYAALVAVGIIGVTITRGLKLAQARLLSWSPRSDDW